MKKYFQLAAITVLVAGGVLAAGNASGSTPHTAAKTGDSNVGLRAVATDASGCIQVNPDTQQQIWVGKPSRDLSHAADEIQALVDAHPASLRGVSYCSHYEGIVLFVSAGATADATDAVAKASRKYPSVKVTIEKGGPSIREVDAAAASVATQMRTTDGIVSVGPNIVTGGLEIGIDDSKIDKAKVQSLVASPLSRTTSPTKAIPINIVTQNGPATNSTRAADFSPFAMGAELRYSYAGGNYVCSAGVPISLNGFKLLTAGHCMGSEFKNNGTTVGTTYTTSYPGNASIYGDWKLIQGSHYALKVFNGNLSSNSTLPIAGGNWGSRPNGAQICASGRTTGQTCGYVVTGSYQYFTADGVQAGHQLRMYHDANFDGVGDRSGWSGGDSGGPCYYANGSGAVVMNGIVRGRITPSSGAFTYYCTQLSGVRAWAPSATVG